MHKTKEKQIFRNCHDEYDSSSDSDSRRNHHRSATVACVSRMIVERKLTTRTEHFAIVASGMESRQEEVGDQFHVLFLLVSNPLNFSSLIFFFFIIIIILCTNLKIK